MHVFIAKNIGELVAAIGLKDSDVSSGSALSLDVNAVSFITWRVEYGG